MVSWIFLNETVYDVCLIIRTDANAFRALRIGSVPSNSASRCSLMMVNPVVGGSVVALVTPMTERNDVDFENLKSLLSWHVAQGSDGAVILGTTGEASTISMEEREKIIKTAVATVNGAFPIIVGTGTIDGTKVIELSKQALECGADATLIITPYYVKPPQRALVQHFLRIADAVPLPMILYNCPGRTGVDMKPATVAQMSTHPNVPIPLSPQDRITLTLTIFDRSLESRTPPGISPEWRSWGICAAKTSLFLGINFYYNDAALVTIVFRIFSSGEDDSGCEFVKIGGDGVISVTANVAPSSMHK